MRKVWAVIRREYRDRIRKKSFWIGTLIFPLLMGLLIFGQFGLMKLKTGEQRRLAVIDATGELGQPIRTGLEEHQLGDGRPEYLVELVDPRGNLERARREVEPRVASGELYGVLAIGEELQAGDNFRFYGRNVGDMMAVETIERELRDAVVGLRLARSDLGIERDQLDGIMAPVRFETFQVSKGGETKRKGFIEAYFGTFAFVMILYMALLLYGVAVMRGILEEKSNRIMEVLLGSLSPSQLMTGKIVGIGLVGLTQMAVYAVTAGALRVYVMAQRIDAEWTSALDAFSLVRMAYFMVFFLLGYFMYTALFASVGAVCNSEQEAQNLQGPLIMCLVIPMVTTFFFVANPDSTIAVVVSLIPLFTPMVMFMRISVLTPPFWQIVLSVAIMLVTIWLFFRGAARVFRIGILMYGKRPSLPEIWRWARG
jgi:ABC-2 type transport system permease protein